MNLFGDFINLFFIFESCYYPKKDSVMTHEKIKWGILGTGWIARKFADALKVANNCQLYAVGSRTKEQAFHFAADYRLSRAYSSYEELVADPEIDVVYIATPHNLHSQNTRMALNAGKHVLCEKPIGVNLQEVNEMFALARQKNLFLMEAMWSRFLPHIIKTKELIEQGVIGNVNLLTAKFCIHSKPNPQHRHYNVDLCGGTLLDIGIYNVFLALFLLGKPADISAIATLSDQGVDTNCSYSFRYPNGTLAIMYSSFLGDPPVTAEIYGSRGTLLLDHFWFCPGRLRLVDAQRKETCWDFEVAGNGYQFEAEEVARCIQQSKTESEIWTSENSRELVGMMDSIRQICKIEYPLHDN